MQENVEELLIKGQRCLNLGNPKEAIRYYSNILFKDPDNVLALVKSGNILGKLGKYSQAISFYDRVLEKDPGDILSLINKGLSLHFLTRWDEALVCYDKVLSLRENNSLTLYYKASTLVKKGKIKEGLDILKKLIEMDYSFKAKAKFDLDFQEIKNLTDFKKIIT